MSSELRTKTTRTFNEFVQLVKQLRESCEERQTERELDRFIKPSFKPNTEHKI